MGAGRAAGGARDAAREARTTSTRAPSSSSSPARCRATSTTTSTPRRSTSSRAGSIPAALDCDGEPLRLGVEAEPLLVSPNQREAEALVGQEFHDDEDFALALDRIAERGARNVIITTEAGCFALLREGARRRAATASVAPRVEPVSKVGARRHAARRVPRRPQRRPLARGRAARRGRGGRRLDARARRRPLRPAPGAPPPGRRRGDASCAESADRGRPRATRRARYSFPMDVERFAVGRRSGSPVPRSSRRRASPSTTCCSCRPSRRCCRTTSRPRRG